MSQISPNNWLKCSRSDFFIIKRMNPVTRILYGTSNGVKMAACVCPGGYCPLEL